MHDEFVEPSKEFANVIVKDLGDYRDHFESYKQKLKSLVKR